MTTRRLARELRSYVVGGLYERVGPVVYNTAVLIDRDGKLAGRYRKTHLPREEWEAGITPGDSYPVFTTDFGKIGLMISWDVQFPEPWRELGLQGAELVLMPIWGGSETLLRARVGVQGGAGSAGQDGRLGGCGKHQRAPRRAAVSQEFCPVGFIAC